MTSPIIDENVMVDALTIKSEEKPELRNYMGRIRTGALLMMIDAHDRKCTRDEFTAAVEACANTLDALARLSMMSNMKDFLEHHKEITDADIEKTISSCVGMVESGAESAVVMAKRLMLCPMNEDPVH